MTTLQFAILSPTNGYNYYAVSQVRFIDEAVKYQVKLALQMVRIKNLCAPLWHEVANSIYQHKMYPHTFRRLNQLGQRAVDRLLRRPSDFLNVDKYSSLGGRDDYAIAQNLIEA